MLPNNPTVQPWASLQDLQWSGILIGNGASQVIWERFAYSSLFEISCSHKIPDPLGDEALSVFAVAEGTRNFEEALRWLGIAARVNQAIGLDHQTPLAIYATVRRALVQSVRWIHPTWDQVNEDVRSGVRSALLPFEWVFTTNYDLLVYWAMMLDPEGTGFKDFLWSGVFDPSDTEVWGNVSRVLYLHGALHLERRPDGRTYKRQWQPGGNLLDTFEQEEPGISWPLFVSEGTDIDKRRAIASSDYLAFAYRSLVDHRGPLVVFGHSLGGSDAHLVDAIAASPTDRVAISIRFHSEKDPQLTANRYKALLPEKQLLFFDSATHPLGSPELQLPDNAAGLGD